MAWLHHVRRLWGPWWPLPAGLPLAYVLLVAAFGEFRIEHGLVVGLCCVLAYSTPKIKAFFLAATPYLLTAIAYDAVRYPRAAWVTAPRVLGCGLRNAELRWFGVGPETTLQDWFTVHHSPALDLLCAVPYFAFVYVVLGYAVYLFVRDRPRMSRFLWSYAVTNFIAFGFWLALPAAPPWYLRAQGCTIDLAALPSPAGLARVDTLLGIGYFSQFYSRATSVFGALPSMHCAFPLLGLITAWRSATWRTRPIHIAYTLLMAFAAVYLDHHWVIDVLAGWLVAIVAVLITDKMLALSKQWTTGFAAQGPAATTSPPPARGEA